MKTLLRIFMLPFALLFLFSNVVSAQETGADPGILRIHYLTLLVKNYDEALSWYTGVLGFTKIEDRSFGSGQRWVIIAPAGQPEQQIVLDVPKPGDKDALGISCTERIGKETNWVLEVKDCKKFYDITSKKGVRFLQPPTQQPWGATQATFVDLYGNIYVVESNALSSN